MLLFTLQQQENVIKVPHLFKLFKYLFSSFWESIITCFILKKFHVFFLCKKSTWTALWEEKKWYQCLPVTNSLDSGMGRTFFFLLFLIRDKVRIFEGKISQYHWPQCLSDALYYLSWKERGKVDHSRNLPQNNIKC